MAKTFRPAGSRRNQATRHKGNTHKRQTTRSGNAGENELVEVIQVQIDTLDHEGVGVARQHSPVAFVAGALPDEVCVVQVDEQKRNVVRGHAKAIAQPHPNRTTPFCRYFEQCGGCQTQHVSHKTMLQMKQPAIDGLLHKFAPIDTTATRDGLWQAPLTDKGTHYRRKTRLALDCRRSHDLRLGFRAQGSSEVISIESCPVLQPALNQLLPPLQLLIAQLQNPSGIGHIELLLGDEATTPAQDLVFAPTTPLMVLRTTKTLPAKDKQQLAQFAQEHGCSVALEIKPGEYEVLAGEAAEIHYSLLDGTRLRALPNDFMQVNPDINRAMINQAMQWLDVCSEDKLLDLFCGIGNFSLSLAKVAQSVAGVEGVPEMVQRAKHNAQLNNIANAQFYCQDLAAPNALKKWRDSGINKVLLDPARGGAKSLMPQIRELNPEKVLYVSCNPATFGRDIAVLCGNATGSEQANSSATERELAIKHLAGKTLKQAKPKAQVTYKLEKIALLDMFPYTAHTEMMALFVRQ